MVDLAFRVWEYRRGIRHSPIESFLNPSTITYCNKVQ